MNDPHVVALHYDIQHRRSLDYGKASPLGRSESAFDVHVEHKKARFTMKEHHATEEGACAAVEEYIRAWEFEATLQHGPDAFKLRFDYADIEDRKPTPGLVVLRARPARFAVSIDTPRVTVSPPSYPSPPSTALTRSPDVESMFTRYVGYREGKEPLVGMAYFCLTVLKASEGPKSGAERDIAKFYGIRPKVLSELRRLSSSKGGTEARKATGIGHDLNQQERRFLEDAVKAIIRRAAEVAHDSSMPRAMIALSDLPGLEGI